MGEGDADAAERPELILERQPDVAINRIFWKAMAGPGHPVARTLGEGDELAGFRVEVPGHSRGHIAFWRERDGVLVLGDVLNSQHPLTGLRGLRLPPGFFTPDPAQNRRSAQRLGELKPQLVLFGHGPPLRDTGRFVGFARSLEAR